jgi:hypothetical protein
MRHGREQEYVQFYVYYHAVRVERILGPIHCRASEEVHLHLFYGHSVVQEGMIKILELETPNAVWVLQENRGGVEVRVPRVLAWKRHLFGLLLEKTDLSLLRRRLFKTILRWTQHHISFSSFIYHR